MIFRRYFLLFFLIQITSYCFALQCYERADSAYKAAEALYNSGNLAQAGAAFMETAEIELGCEEVSFENLSMELTNGAFCFEASQNFTEAMTAYSLLMHYAEQQGDSSIIALCNYNKSRMFMYLGQIDSAVVYGNKAYDQYVAIGDFTGIAVSAGIIADQKLYAGSIKESISFLRMVIASIETEASAQQPAADLDYKIGQLYSQLQKRDSALYFMENAFDYYAAEGAYEKTATIALEIGDLYVAVQDNVNALEYYGKAHESYVVLDDAEGIAICLNQRGRIMADIGRINEGLADLHESEMLFRANGQKGGLASVLSNRAAVFGATSQYDSALVYFDESKQLFLQLGDMENAARVLNNIANIYIATSRYGDAAKIYTNAIASMDTTKPDDLSAAYIGLGAVYASWGRTDKALMYYQEALAKAELSKNPEKIAVAHNNIGGVFQSQGKYTHALQEYNAALKQYQSIGLQSKVLVVQINIGSVLQGMGQSDLALASFSSALSLAERLLDKSSVAACDDYMAVIYQQQGKTDLAEELFLQAIAVRRSIGERERLAHSLNNLAVLYIENQQFAEATSLLEESVAIVELLRMDASEDAKREFFGTQIFCYQNLILAHIQLENYDLAFYYAEQSKAKHLTEQIAGSQTVSVPTLGAVQAELADNQIAFMFSTTDINDITQMAITNSATDAILQSKDQFLLGLLQDEQVRRDVVSGLERKEISALQNFVDGTDSTRRLSRQLSQKIFYNTVKSYIALINKPDYKNVRKARVLGQHLYQFLVAPFTDQLAGKNEIIIIADGILSYLPFESLVIGANNYMAQAYTVTYQHSFTIYNLLKERESAQPEKELLAFGMSDYATYRAVADSVFMQDVATVKKKFWKRSQTDKLTDLYAALNYNQFSDLAYSKIETEELKTQFSDAQVLCNAEATETRLKELSAAGTLKQYQFLHFSAHGVSVGELPEMSALLLYPSKTDDGYVTLSEIAGLAMHADLVSLSACNTGIGKVYSGEGVVGIAQAFFIAGAQAVLATLWEVDEESTSAFIQCFYRYAQQNGGNYSAALVSAKRDFIDGKYGYAWSLPYFWTPFVLYGQGL